jgi:hypothetical protein
MMNSYYWPNPFTYLGWGHHKFFAYCHVDQADMTEEDVIRNIL